MNFDKYALYNEKIAPLTKQIHEIAVQEGIPFIAVTNYAVQEESSHLLATTCFLPEDTSDLLYAIYYLLNTKQPDKLITLMKIMSYEEAGLHETVELEM